MALDFVEHNLLRIANKLRYLIEPREAIRAKRLRLRSYLQADQRPWAIGYEDFKWESIARNLSDEVLLDKFRTSSQLPSGYGRRLDARLVEIPWVLSRMEKKPAVMLDAGSSLNFNEVVDSAVMRDIKLTILTLAPESRCYWKKGVSYVFEDLRKLPFCDNYFDVIACISTIEHVGMDNSLYAKKLDKARSTTSIDFKSAVKELRRVLKPGGPLYVTFPFGKYENHGWFQQFDAALLNTLVQTFAPSTETEAIYKYTPDGWQISNREACASCEYFDVYTSKYFDSQSTIDFPSDYPAGERAVACLELHKRE